MTVTRRAFAAGLAIAGVARPAILRAAEPLTVGYVPANAIHWGQSVAIEKGFYGEVGFAAEVAVMQSSPHAIQMAISGGFQVAASQPEPFVAAVQRGATMLGAISAPMNSADWGLVGASSVRSLADLKGQVIGVSSQRTSESSLTDRLLAAQGFAKGDVSYLQVGTSPAKIAALQKGAIGAAVLFEPCAEIAIRQGLPLLARYRTMRSCPPGLYVVNQTWATRGDAGRRVAHAIQHAHAWLWDPANKAEAIRILAKYAKIGETTGDTVLAAVYREYFVTDRIYGRDGAIELAGLQRALDDMASEGEVFKVAPPARRFVLDPQLGAILA
jgi:ABC-type nitrate/sulfonate/bicarbonate transport system substrate-binding protein